jgi:hypothetical protein
MIDVDMIERIERFVTPSPYEQLQWLILWMGEKATNVPNKLFELTDPELRAILAAVSETVVQWVVEESLRLNFTRLNGNLTSQFRLTMQGWQFYDELQRGKSDSKMPFMAMKFGQEPLTSIFLNCFKPAVARTGFHLETVIDKPKAGSIDDKIRVEIRNARFLVVDLTHGNPGAYFEAGFAEGLGKPVFYVCETDAFDHGRGTHFDCNHHYTIPWSADDPSGAAEELVNAIRNTLPGEAIMTD